MPEPYWQDAASGIMLYHGDMREVLPAIGGTYDCAVVDPPYAETSLAWDRWPNGWPSLVAEVTSSMWCFGSARMFDQYRDEILCDWKMSQDVIWSKGRGVGSVTDRFYRTHEHVRHYYRDAWNTIYKESPRQAVYGPRKKGPTSRPSTNKTWHGERGATVWVDDGTRMVKSVIEVPGLWGHDGHPTQKPVGILDPLIRYACPPGGTVLDVFAGSGSTAEAARASGRKAVLIERHEPYCEVISQRLSQGDLFGGAA
jgi:site-specific DNA-methyltransferase (adenine-specific)